jgi:uncharacterized RDD family membrane protein YckC
MTAPTPTPDDLAACPAPGLLRRLGAMVYDGLLVLAIVLTTTGLLNVFAPRPEIPEGAASVSIEDMQTVSGPLLSGLLFVEIFAFFAFFWVRHGRTLGMQAWRLRVVAPDGHRIGLDTALKRFIAAIPALGLFGLGYLWVWIDPQRRAWTDLLSGSRTIVVPKDGA